MSFKFDGAPIQLHGKRVKAGFHCHTVKSDGGLTPEQTIERYQSKGFHCVGITDHHQVTVVDVNNGFLSLNSTENGGHPDIIGVGVKSAVNPDLPLSERASMLTSQGGFTIAAHPTYCGVLPDTYVECDDLMAMEIYNAYCDAAYTNGYAVELWDMVLGKGKRIFGVAGDDAHLNPRKRQYSDAGLGWVEIWAETLTRESVLHALKGGVFFSTQAPVFDEIEVEESAIRVTCSSVKEVRWRTFGSVGYVDYAPEGSCLTSSSLPDWFHPNKYVRIELVDHEGKRAWSNPIFVSSESVDDA